MKGQKSNELEGKILDLYYENIYTNREIAEMLKITEQTVSKYTKNL